MTYYNNFNPINDLEIVLIKVYIIFENARTFDTLATINKWKQTKFLKISSKLNQR